MSSNYIDGHRRPRRVPLDPVPVRVAVRARPDGAASRDAAARPVGRVEPGAVHRREQPARLGLGEARPLGMRHNVLVDADVVVIGAGALGLSTALHCALAGRSVVVVERHTAGSQASGWVRQVAGLAGAEAAPRTRSPATVPGCAAARLAWRCNGGPGQLPASAGPAGLAVGRSRRAAGRESRDRDGAARDGLHDQRGRALGRGAAGRRGADVRRGAVDMGAVARPDPAGRRRSGRARPRARRPGGIPGQEQPGLPGGSSGRRAARRGLRRDQLAGWRPANWTT